jgi:hypothetical protein
MVGRRFSDSYGGCVVRTVCLGGDTTSFLNRMSIAAYPYVPSLNQRWSDRRGKRHAGNRGMAAQTRDACAPR